MTDTHDYPLAEVLDAGNTIHYARHVGLLGSRIETRCGLQGYRSGRDGGVVCAECVARERAKADTHDERGGDEMPVCSTPCDPDCDAVCHEDHVAGHKKRHWPYDCPAADEYFWDGDQFTADAIKRLRGERDAATARAEKAEAERRIATALSNRRKVERNQARALMYSIIGAIECAYALNTYVELEPGETAPTIESLWAEVREIRGLTADAAQDGLSEPVADVQPSGGHGEGSNSSATVAGPSEVEDPCGTADPPSGSYFPHVCGRNTGHRPPHICEHDDCRKTWTTEDEPHMPGNDATEAER